MMAEIHCEIHGFPHCSYLNTPISSSYTSLSNILTKVNIKGSKRRYKAVVYFYLANFGYVYLFEGDEICDHGYNNKDNGNLTCVDRQGVLLIPSSIRCCLVEGVHTTLEVFSDKVINEDSSCCISPLTVISSKPNLVIGAKFILKRNILQNFIGVCKWIGKINNIECIGAEMIDWHSNEFIGMCMGKKLFDCREGHGVFLRCSDVEIETPNPENLDFVDNGFVNLKNIYQVTKSTFSPKDMVKIGTRMQLLVYENKSDRAQQHKIIFGVVKWIGTINKGRCVGIELDYPCEGGMDGNIRGSESFSCESGKGALCSINNVTFDYYAYSVAFTVFPSFNIDGDLICKEDWHKEIVRERDLKMNGNIYVLIEENDRILNLKGVLKWFGHIQEVLVGVLEMPDDFPITAQQKVTRILKEFNPVSHIIVHSQYLFKYRALKSYEKSEYNILNFDVGKTTSYGVVRWKGVDESENLYYAFERESISDTGTDGTFCGQRLFQCDKGLGILISANGLYESIYSKTAFGSDYKLTDKSEAENTASIPSDSMSNEWINLLATMANDGVVAPETILSTAMEMDSKTFLGPLLSKITPSINILKSPELVSRLLKVRSFDCLQIAVDQHPIDDDNNKRLLQVAAESLKFGELALFEACMKKCTNKDVLMENGETLITQIIKEKVNQSVIVRVIESYEFDMTQPNTDKCIPLTLACGNMMMDVVDCIVQTIKRLEIRKRVCAICMDRNIGTVFNCGHNSCKECSENISSCHLCNEKIVTRGVLYLN